jgi:hypothetical protein
MGLGGIGRDKDLEVLREIQKEQFGKGMKLFNYPIARA